MRYSAAACVGFLGSWVSVTEAWCAGGVVRDEGSGLPSPLLSRSLEWSHVCGGGEPLSFCGEGLKVMQY